MKIHLLAIGTRMPDWVTQGFEAYAKRLPHDFALTLTEINAHKRLKNTDIARVLEQESEQLISAVPKASLCIGLERTGRPLDTPSLASQLSEWHDHHQSISLLIGGPEGLSKACLQQCHQRWSLSNLTLPHPLVRVLIAEQIYRAWSTLTHHPYHRN